MSKIKQICKTCKKEFFAYPSKIKQGATKNCSVECSAQFRKGMLSGKDNPMWKGNNVGYKALHGWINTNFGKANFCEFDDCRKKSSKFEWALKKGREYSRERMDYFSLCVSCHRKYDKTEISKAKTSKTLMGHKSWNNWKSIKRDKGGRFK